MNHKQSSNNSIVCIQKSTYSNIDIEKLLSPLGGMKKYIDNGDRVLLKVNLLSASTPDSAVVTHPALVRAVVKEVQNAHGIPIIADSPSREFTKSRLEKVYESSGLTSLASDLGIELNYDTSSRKVPVPNGKKIKKVPIANFILNTDKIIALPKVKTHSLMIMTLATKIMYGAIPGLTKARYHSRFFTRKAFSEMLLDILLVKYPNLFIMDGIVGMEGEGPMGGDPVKLGVLLASEDAVGMDLAICEMLGIEPIGVPPLKRANLRGWWPANISYPILSPANVKYPSFRLPSTAGYLLTGTKRPKRSPVPKKNCNACGECQEICPKGAIEIINERARINYSKCIQCYCCHEICPEKAIKLELVH